MLTSQSFHELSTYSCENYRKRTRASESDFIEPTQPLTVGSADSHPKKFLKWLASKFTPGSIKGSVISLVGATMGAGILLMPYSFYESGLTFSIIQIVLCAVLSYYSATLLALCADQIKKYDYFEVAAACYGKYMQFLVKIVLFVNNWGGLVVYTILITNFLGTSLKHYFPNGQIPNFLTDQNSLFWPPIFTTFIVLPLSLQRDFSSLRFACLLGFAFIIYLCFVIIYSAFTLNDMSYNLSQVSHFKFSGLGITFPTVIFSFAYHPNVLVVYDELQRPCYRRIKKVLGRAIAISSTIFIIFGTFGYLAFADNSESLTVPRNILFSFSYKGWPAKAIIALFLIGINIILIMPLSAKPARDALGELIFNTNISEEEKIEQDVEEHLIDPEEVRSKKHSTFRHVILVLLVVYSQMLVGMFVKSMAQIIQILGATTLSLMCYNFPCLFYLKLDKSVWYAPKRLFAHFVNIIMIIVGIYSLYRIFAS